MILPDRFEDTKQPESPPSEIINDQSPTHFDETAQWNKEVTSSADEEKKKRIEEEERLATIEPEDDEVLLCFRRI